MYMGCMVWILIIACMPQISEAEEEEEFKLVFVQMIYRHGDRAPSRLYPNDPNPRSFWTRGLKALSLLGKKQHFSLGKLFRSMYENFTTSNPSEVDVLSSATDRCIESAATNLASFYAPNEMWRFDEEVNWQPIPIHYYPLHEDKYLYYNKSCPKADIEKNRMLTSPSALLFLTKYKDAINSVALNSGIAIQDPVDWLSLYLFYDTLWIEKRYNLTIPEWVEPHWNTLEEFSDSFFYWWFKSSIVKRLRAGPLLQKIIQKMREKIDGDIPHLKFQIYSGHDATLAVVLHSLNLLPKKKIPYCATIIFELYRSSSGSHFLRLLYLNSTEPEKIHQAQHILVLDGSEEYCPFEYFVNYTQYVIPEDWDEECKVEEDN